MLNKRRARMRLGVAGVSACTLVAGMPLLGVTSAQAAHSGKVEFFSPFLDADSVAASGAFISSQNDGTDNLVHLLTDAPADTTSVTFSWAPTTGPNAGVFTTIGTDTAAPWTVNWDPSAAGLANGTVIDIRAQNVNPTLNTTDTERVTVSTSQETVNITNPNIAGPTDAAPSVGRFNGKVVISGTVSPAFAATAGATVTVSDITGKAAPASGPVPPVVAGSPTTTATLGTTNATSSFNASGQWTALIETNQDPGRGAIYPNAVTGGQLGDPTDETEFATVYEQTVQNPVFDANPTTPANDPLNDSPGDTSNILVTINDQNGNPVADALVEFDFNRDGDSTDPAPGGGSNLPAEFSGQTDTFGQITIPAFPAIAAPGGTRQFDIIVNQTANTGTIAAPTYVTTPGFDSSAGDKRTTVTQTTTTPVVTAAVIETEDLTPQTTTPGTVDNPVPSFPKNTRDFDVTEEDPTVRVFVTNQSGNPFPNTPATTANWTVVFDNNTPDDTSDDVTTTGSGVLNNGYLTIPVAGAEGKYTVSAYVNLDSDAAQTPGDVIAAPVVLNFDTASILFDGKPSRTTSVHEAGGTATRVVTYMLDDGTALVGRIIAIGVNSSTRGVGQGPADFDNGIPGVNPPQARALSDANGQASFTLNDPQFDSDPGTAGIQLDNEIINVGTEPVINPAGTAVLNGSPGDTTTVRFEPNATPAEIRLHDISNPTGADTPGRPIQVGLNIDNILNATGADTGIDLAGQPVSLSLDNPNAYFTSPGNRTDANHSIYNGVANLTHAIPATPPTAEGAPVGAYRRDTGPKTLVMNDDGDVFFTVAIDRDAGFDDDGLVTVNVTAVAGSITRVIPLVFSTDADSVVASPTNDQPSRDITNFNHLGGNPLNPLGPNSIFMGPVPGNTLTGISSANDPQGWFVGAQDQFGNLAGIDVDFTTAGGQISDTPTGGFGTTENDVKTSFFNEVANPMTGADLWTRSTLPGSITTGPEQTETQTVTGTFTFGTLVYGDSDAGTAGFQLGMAPYTLTPGTSTQTVTQALDYYTPIQDQFQYGFAATPGNEVPKNTAVNVVAGVADQRGTPVQGALVNFIRSGPGEQVGGTPAPIATNAQGLAGFTITSPIAGTAAVTVIVTVNGIEQSRGVVNVNFTEGGNPTGAPTIGGDAKRFYNFGQNLTIAGTAPAGADVQFWFDRRGPEGPRLVRTLNGATERQAGSTNYSYTVRPGDDYRIYVVVNGQQSNTIIAFALPTVDSKPGQTVAANGVVTQPSVGNRLTASGRAPAGAPFVFYYRIQGEATFRFNVLTTGSNGVWTRPLALPAGKFVAYYVQRGGDTPRSPVYVVTPSS